MPGRPAELAERAIGDVLSVMGVGEETAVVEGRAFLEALVEGEFG